MHTYDKPFIVNNSICFLFIVVFRLPYYYGENFISIKASTQPECVLLHFYLFAFLLYFTSTSWFQSYSITPIKLYYTKLIL